MLRHDGYSTNYHKHINRRKVVPHTLHSFALPSSICDQAAESILLYRSPFSQYVLSFWSAAAGSHGRDFKATLERLKVAVVSILGRISVKIHCLHSIDTGGSSHGPKSYELRQLVYRQSAEPKPAIELLDERSLL